MTESTMATTTSSIAPRTSRGAQHHGLGQAAHEVAAAHLGLHLVGVGSADPIATLISSAVRSPMAMPYSRRTNVWIAASMSKLPTRTASSATMPPSEMTRGLAGATTDVDDHVADRLVDRQPGADRRGHRLLDELRFGRTGTARRLGHGTLFDFGDGRRHADHDTRAVEPRHPTRWSSSRIIFSVTSKSVMAPPRSGRTATM